MIEQDANPYFENSWLINAVILLAARYDSKEILASLDQQKCIRIVEIGMQMSAYFNNKFNSSTISAENVINNPLNWAYMFSDKTNMFDCKLV